MLRAFLALALGEDAAIPLGQVKTILDSDCKLAQWQIPAVLDSLCPQWPTDDVELCQVLVTVLDNPENMEQLATLPQWQQIKPVSEKTNW